MTEQQLSVILDRQREVEAAGFIVNVVSDIQRIYSGIQKKEHKLDKIIRMIEREIE
ncbi:MAG: hypothetical protein ACUZ8N_14370 [Candidatus Scalindua sp.]